MPSTPMMDVMQAVSRAAGSPCSMRAGWYTNMKGMTKATIPSLTEITPVFMALAPAMAAPEKEATQTGGVMAEMAEKYTINRCELMSENLNSSKAGAASVAVST